MARLSEVMKGTKPKVEPKRQIGATGEFEPKPAYEQISVEKFPKLGTFQDVAGQYGTAFFNQLLGQLPEAILRKKGYELPEPVTTPGKVAEAVGGIAGVVGGVPARAGLAATRAVGTLPRAARLAIGGAAAGAVVTPRTETGEILAPKQRAMQAALGAGVGYLAGVGANIARNIRNVKNPVRLAEKTQDVIMKAKRKASDEFGKAINILTEQNPNRSVSLRNEIDVILAEMRESPKLASIVKRIPSIKNLINNPEFADNITLQKSQEILNSLTAKISKAKLAGLNVTFDDLPVLDFIDDVRYEQLKAFPEMSKVRTDYANVLEKYNVIKKDLKVGSLINAMKKRWREPQVKKRIEGLLPKELIREIGGYRKAADFISMSASIGKYAIKVGTLGAVGYKLFGRGNRR